MYYRLVNPPRAMRGLGDLQRQNPLPAGRYWIDVFGDDRDKMAAWMQANSASVMVESTTEDKGQSWYVTQAITDWIGWSTSEDPATASVRYTFRVSSPVPWDAATYGYPNILDDVAPTPATPGNKPTPAPGKAASPKPGASAPSSGMSGTTVAVAAGVVLIGAVAFAVMHRKAS